MSAEEQRGWGGKLSAGSEEKSSGPRLNPGLGSRARSREPGDYDTVCRRFTVRRGES